MMAVVFQIPGRNLFAVFVPSVEEGMHALNEARRGGATFAAIVTGDGRAVQRIRAGGMYPARDRYDNR